jgi:hypothetical protein
MNEQPSLNSVLRDQAFLEIREICPLTESYSRSLAEAAFRGDERTVRAHLEQMRACVIAMIRTYKDYLQGKGEGLGDGRSANI